MFHHPDRGFQKFSLPRWNPPWGLSAAILETGLLSFPDRLRLLRIGKSLITESTTDLAEMTITEWLDVNGQSADCRRSIWEPLAVSIMNEGTNRASAVSFVQALRDAFLGSWKNARLAIPRVGLSQLYVESAKKFILELGGSIICDADVVEVGFTDSLATGVTMRDGTSIRCKSVILAVPPNRVSAMIPGPVRRELSLNGLDLFTFSPIVSTHLWFEEDFMMHDFVGLVGRTTQWVFNKRKLTGVSGKGGHVSAVISAAHNVVSLTNDEIVAMTMEDLRSAYGPRTIVPLHSIVVREKRATVSLTPSTEGLRPSQKTAIRNLFLAGDWTRTGYPATIEGALLSADRCTELAMTHLRSSH
jgi:squalene-associated FAD-dependent desaturase